MKYRKKLSLITAIILGTYLLLFIANRSNTSTDIVPGEPLKLADYSSIESIEKIQPFTEAKVMQQVIKDDIKVIAQTSKEAEVLSSIFYNDVFSIQGIEDGFMYDVQPGRSIDVINFFNSADKKSQFVPLYANNRVVGVSIFREYKEGEKELGRMTEIQDEWYSYPPIAPYDSEFEMNTHYPSVSYKQSPGYYYIEDGETPYYLYEGSDGYLTTYYLVSAYDKQIVVKEDRSVNESGTEPDLPVKMSNDGILEIDFSKTSGFSKDEMERLVSDTELTNRYIIEGLMGFDENMNITFDKRSSLPVENIFTAEEDESYYDANQYDSLGIESSGGRELMLE